MRLNTLSEIIDNRPPGGTGPMRPSPAPRYPLNDANGFRLYLWWNDGAGVDVIPIYAPDFERAFQVAWIAGFNRLSDSLVIADEATVEKLSLGQWDEIDRAWIQIGHEAATWDETFEEMAKNANMPDVSHLDEWEH